MAPAASDDCFSGTNVWMFANFLKHNADKIELLSKSPLHRNAFNSFILPGFLSLIFLDFVIFGSPLL